MNKTPLSPADTGADNDRSPWNLARVYHAPDLLAFYRRYAQLRMQLLPYLAAEAAYCAQSARPLMAHLVLDWPDDEQAAPQHILCVTCLCLFVVWPVQY